jgi:hypothetical protein
MHVIVLVCDCMIIFDVMHDSSILCLVICCGEEEKEYRHLRDYSYIRESLLSVCIVCVLYVIVCLVESLHCVCLVWENS